MRKLIGFLIIGAMVMQVHGAQQIVQQKTEVGQKLTQAELDEKLASISSKDPDYKINMKKYLDLGADVNTLRGSGFPILTRIAAGFGDIEDVKMLLAVKGIDVNCQYNRDGSTALMDTAFCRKDPEIIAALIDADADPNMVSAFGDSFYGYATSELLSNPLVVEALENYKKRMAAKNKAAS